VCSIEDFRESFWQEHSVLPTSEDYILHSFFIVNIVDYFRLSRDIRFDLDEWIFENAKDETYSEYLNGKIFWIFSSKSDALLFKLTWGGK
jgi:hypothetical protein